MSTMSVKFLYPLISEFQNQKVRWEWKMTDMTDIMDIPAEGRRYERN